jgi:hypothetical protein
MKQTAVDKLVEQLQKFGYLHSDIHGNSPKVQEAIREAKAMEKEQIMKTARQCHFEGVRHSAKNSEEYLQYGEKYYNETYGGNQ